MRRLIASLMFILATVFMLTACGDSDSDTSQYALSDISAAIKEAVEYPETMEGITDPQRLKDDWGLSSEDYEEVYAIQSPITVHLYELIVVKPKDGHTEAVVSALNGRIDKLKNELAFYPNQVDIANAAVVGKKGDFVYLIAHEDAAKAKKAIDNL